MGLVGAPLPEAEAVQREVYEARRRIRGADHLETIGSESVLARLVRENKRYDEAESLFQKTLENQRRVLGPRNYTTLATMYNMASTFYWDQGQFEKADRLLRDTYEIARQDHDDTHCFLAAYNLACLAAQRGDRSAALAWPRNAIDCDFRDFEAMSQDPDLLSLHEEPEFERLVAAARSNAGKPTPGSR